MDSFFYLGSAIDKQGGTDRDVTAGIGKARAAFVMLENIWASKEISTRIKLRIFNSNVKSVLLYGSETWRKTKTMLRKIQTFINTCLRRIYKAHLKRRSVATSGTRTSGQGNSEEEVGLDQSHPPEAGIQHNTPSPNLEPAGEEEERPASQQLEARH